MAVLTGHRINDGVLQEKHVSLKTRLLRSSLSCAFIAGILRYRVDFQSMELDEYDNDFNDSDDD